MSVTYKQSQSLVFKINVYFISTKKAIAIKCKMVIALVK